MDALSADPADPHARDTSAEALAVQTACYRRMTPARKLEIVRTLNRRADAFALAGIAERYPDADEEERRMRLLALKLGPELTRAAYGWSPDD